MKRSARRPLALRLLAGSVLAIAGIGCRNEPPQGTADAASDAGPALPDARVLAPTDSGTSEESPPPTLGVVTPPSGSERGGTRVTLRGTSFLEPAEVFFGDAPAVNVVVLDEVSIAATTPPGAVGRVTVRVATPGGIADLPDGFRYRRELLLLEVRPARVPEEGGVPVTIIGKGFDAYTMVLFDRTPLIGARLVNDEIIEGFAPRLAPGRPEIRVFHREAETRRSDLLYVYATPSLRAIAPGYGPTTGSAPQSLQGDGFEQVERVRFGAALGTNLASDRRADQIRVSAPALASGAHDVTIENADALGTLRAAYVAYDPVRAGLDVLGVVPRRASTSGGELIAIVGYGFPQDATVRIGGVSATVTRIDRPNAITAIVPSGLPEGAADVAVSAISVGSVTATAAGALDIYRPLAVSAVTPAAGPAAGGTAVTISGRGFASGGVSARIGDVPLADVVIVDDTRITGRTVAGAHGPQDVVVENADSSGVLRGGFRFEEPFEIVRIEPEEGSIAGNTYVTVFGRGFEGAVSVKFGDTDGVGSVLENGEVIGVRTQPAPTGAVDVTVSTERGEVTLPGAFSFYDPRLITGGAWGGPIEGSVNIGIFDATSGEPIPGMAVQLGYEADPRYLAVTDENGLTTISNPEIRGAQTVTAGANGIEFVTFMELNARNLTIFASPYPTSPAPDAPVPPCPSGGQPPTVRGRVFKFKSSLDPVTRPGWVPVARITYSQPNVFQTNPPQPPEQVDFVFGDGEEYEIVVMRAGTVAVYAILGDFNAETQTFIPRKMGIVKNVPAAAETVTEGINISLDIDLDKSLVVRLASPPTQLPGPSVNAVFPFLNLESDGVIPFSPTALASGEVTLSGMPSIAASEFFYMGGSFTQGATGGLQAPYSLTLLESGAPFESGLDLGPFLEMPQNPSPKPAQVVTGGRLSWDQGGITPDITTVTVLDVTVVSGCCCIDLSMNGQCEASEPQQCGGLPQQYARWSIFGQGGLESYAMPPMPPVVRAFEPPSTYFWLVQQAIAPRFNYGEFIYNQFSPFFWTSWSVWFSQFVTKEETP